MMPGETPPVAAAAGIAAEAATACANCGALQQNLNEYVAALIALKQKIIDTDHLLTDYEQKCNELKCAERENHSFRQQVEQMLQKLSPLEKCKEELGSVQAELEEKKFLAIKGCQEMQPDYFCIWSSLKIYQDTHQEYVRVKEEMGKSDAMKKKLEAKVKKLEKATEKHNQDFRQLQAEKKVLEKELKKAQEKIESFPSEKQKKVVRHVETQSEREWPVTNLDREKIKLLLEELWLCIDNSTGKSHINKNSCYLADFHHNSRPRGKTKAVHNPPKPKRARGERPSHCSSPEPRTTQTSLTSLQIKLDSSPARHVGQMENEAMETSQACTSDGTPQGSSPGFTVWTDPSESSLDLFSKEPEEAGEDLIEIWKWVRPLPPLLSPIQCSPATTPITLFGELTDSSDEEMDQNAQRLESLVQGCDESAPEACAASKKNPAEPLSHYNSSSVNNKSSDPCELPGRPTALKRNSSVLCSDPLAKSGFLDKIGAKSKDGEKHLEENFEFMEIAVHRIENVTRNIVDVTETENKTLLCDLMSGNCLRGQEKTVEPRHVQELITNGVEQALNVSSLMTKEEKKEKLTRTVEASVSCLIEDDRPPAHKGTNPQQTEEPVFATENILGVPDKVDSSNVFGVAVMKEGSEDTQTEFDLGIARPLTEHNSPEQNRTEELCTGCNGEPEFVNRRMNLDHFKLHSETDHYIDQAQDKHTEVVLMQAVEKDVHSSSASIKLDWAEENYSNKDECHKDSECDINKKTKLDCVDALRPKFHITQSADGWENSLCSSKVMIQTKNESSTAPPASENEEGNKQKIEVENIICKDKRTESILEETPSLAITKGCLQLQDHVDKKDSSGLLQEPGNMNIPVLTTQVSVVKDCLSQPEGLVQTNQAAPQLETITGNASKLEQFEDPDDKLKCMPVIHNASNNIHCVEVIMEDKCLTSERLGEVGGGPLKITGLVAAVECAKGAAPEIVLERPAQSGLVTENSLNDPPSPRMSKQNDKSSSPKPRKSSAEDTKMNECSVTNESVLEVNPSGSSAQSMQNASQAENADPKAASPAILAVSSESSTALFFGTSGPGYDVAANGQSSDPPFVSPSTRADCVGHCNSREHLMGKEADAEHAEGSPHKSLDYCSHNDQDEVEIKRAGEQPISCETQALVHVGGCCVVKNSREIFDALSPNNASAVHTSAANQTILSNDTGLVTASIEKTGSPSRNCTAEHSLSEAVYKETGKMLSSGVSSREVDEAETPDDAVAVVDVSASSSSEEECSLRKVIPTKKHSRLLAFEEELDTVRNSQADIASNMIVSCGVHERLYLAEDASPKDEQAHNGDSNAKEATAETWEHSYAAPYSSGEGSSTLDASVSDEEEADKSVALTNRAEVDNREPASGKLFASDLEVNDGILLPETEHSGSSAKPSAACSAVSAEQERNSAALGWSSNIAQNHLTYHHVDDGTNTAFKKESHVKKEGDILAAITSENSILINSESSSTEKQEVVSQKSELLIKFSKQNGTEQVHKPSDFINLSAKAGAEGGAGRLLPRIPSRKGGRKSRQDSLAETIVANADTSSSMKHFSKTLRKMRQEVGSPLPPLLLPLVATPPRTVQPVSPTMSSSSSQLSFPSPLNELISPLRETPIPPLMSPLSDVPKHKRPALHTTPSPSEMLIGERTLTSPLQFCATTPKHALPVPGRFPPAAGSATPAVPQENSVKILDSMYPELSARAITLNILKGNIQLSRSSLDSKNVPPPVHQISGFKEIASSSTAFVKTGTTLFSEPPSFNVNETGKRMLASPAMPKSAKRLRLDSELLKSGLGKEDLSARDSGAGAQGPAVEMMCLSSGDAIQSMGDSRLILPAEEIDPESRAVTVALEKISVSCFDLLPVIHSRVHTGNMSSIPIMTDAEKEVVHEFGIAKKSLAEPALQAILNKLKHQKTSLGPCHIQSLCRVYVGICQQLRDLEKARLFCYSLLKEGFPQSGKLILFMGNMWSDIFISEGVINKAIQLVVRKRSRGQVLEYLETFLNWKESGPVDIGIMISSLLLAIQLCPQMEFQASEQRGEDLKDSMWEYVFAIDLLCSHQKWAWTHDHVISKELWPIMDKWIKNRKGSGNASSPSDVIVAMVLRLIGRLGQIGLKEGFSSTVKNISSVIGDFLRHAKEQDVPWGVQLAAAYALCELGPSSPSETLQAIRAWETANSSCLPLAVSTGIAEVRSLLKP